MSIHRLLAGDRRSRFDPGCLGWLIIVGCVVAALGALGRLLDEHSAEICVVAVVAAAAAAVYFVQKSRNEERAAVERRHVEFEAARMEHEDLRGEVARLDELWGPDVTNDILRRRLWLGESEDQVVCSFGEPDDVREIVTRTKTTEVYRYFETGVDRFALKVSIEDGVVVGWDDNGAPPAAPFDPVAVRAPFRGSR